METLLPPSTLNNPRLTVETLPSSAMMRVNFIPGVRQRLGWAGMRECPHFRGALTAKLTERRGVYGLALLERTAEDEAKRQARFSLYYFPDPQEEVFEDFSIQACIEALEEDFIAKVRDFPQFPSMCQLFHVGVLSVSTKGTTSLSIQLESPERDVLVAAEGLTITRADGAELKLDAGSIDKNLPSLELAMPFFRSLAASLSHLLTRTPETLDEWVSAHSTFAYGTHAEIFEYQKAATTCKTLRLGWGLESTVEQEPRAETIAEIHWRAPANYPPQYENENWWSERVPGARHSMDLTTLGIYEKPKLIVLTGFLGSGKTSYLTRFIEYQASKHRFVAVVQNEIGEKGLDAQLLGQHYAVAEMDEGCVCCSLVGNLGAALKEISSQYRPDYLVLETTGLANPANLLKELWELENELEFASITCVVDALNALQHMNKYGIWQDQVRLADVVLLNKCDVVSQEELANIEREIARLSPHSLIHRVVNGDISPAALYGVNATVSRTAPEGSQCGCNSQGHSFSCATHSHYNITSAMWQAPALLEEDAFKLAVSKLPDSLLRMKGILNFVGTDHQALCQYVPQALSLTRYRGEYEAEPFLIFIGDKPEESIKLLEAELYRIPCIQ
nr:CobW family GTP-binding protein [Pseudovibrio flavus]